MCHASSLSVTLFKSYIAFFITVINEVKVGSRAGPAKVVVVGWDDAAVQECHESTLPLLETGERWKKCGLEEVCM
jgi:hypothetical protein